MTDDILTRLRKAKNTTLPAGALWRLCDEAADEIERLRAELADGSFYKESDIDRLMDRAEKAEAEIERLRGFVFEIMSGWPEGCDADTFTLQDAAVKYGLLREVPGGYDPAKHYDPFDICEPGDRWYEWAICKPNERSNALDDLMAADADCIDKD